MKYPEFHAFKEAQLDYVEKLKDGFANLSPNDASFPVEAAALNLTIKAIEGFFAELGLESKKLGAKKVTYE